MRIQAGNPVSGDDFYRRKVVIERAWELLEAGSHILIAAPRRVGKTSLMYYLRDHPKENYIFLYLIIESVNNENEYFRRIVNRVVKSDFVTKSRKVMTFLEKHKPTITKLGPDGVEFGVSEEHNYREMLERILKSVEDTNQKLVMMLDEFPQALENIIEFEGARAGTHFLHSNRELRHDAVICRNVRFLYTGSIGLENIVSKLNASKTINDLARLPVPPLSGAEARDFIRLLLENVKFSLDDAGINYILEKIEWLIPFYLQLVIQELNAICREKKITQVSNSSINQAFAEMLEQRNHFEHWHERLRTSLKGNDYVFVKEVLNLISEQETIHSNEILNLAIKHNLSDTYRDLIGALVYDGYINHNDDPALYRYNSPLLRMWWRQNVAH